MNADYPTSYPFTEIVQQIHNSKKRGYHQKDDSFPHSLFGLVLNNPIENKFDLNTLNTSPYNSILCTPFNDEAKDVAQKLCTLYNELKKPKKDLFLDSYKFISECIGLIFNNDYIIKDINLKNWYDDEHTALRKFIQNLDSKGKIETPEKFSFNFTDTQFKKFQYTHSDYHIINWMIVCSVGFLFTNRLNKNLAPIKIQEIFKSVIHRFKSSWFTYLTNEDNVRLYSTKKQYSEFQKSFNREPSSIMEMLLNTKWDLNVLSIALTNFIQTEVMIDLNNLYVDNVANSKLRNSFEHSLDNPTSKITVFEYEMYNAYGGVMKWKGGIDMGHPLNYILGGDMTKKEVIFEDSELNQNPSKERDIVKDAKKYEYILYKVHTKKLNDVISSISNYTNVVSSPDVLLTAEDKVNKKRVEIEQFRFNCFVAYITWKYDDENKLSELIQWGELECGDCNNSWDYLIDPPQEYIDTLESFI